jgi:uncharacterized protein YbaP (TraB family)
MKNIKLWLVLTLLLVTALQNSFAESGDKQGILHPKGLLWKIEKQGMSNSYLYATMHISDPKVTTLSAEVDGAFLQAEHFVMEVLIDSKVIKYISSVIYITDGRKLPEIIGHAGYKRLITLINERNILTEETLQSMKPWAVLMLLMAPQDKRDEGLEVLDIKLYQRAKRRGIKLTGLESIQEQIGVFETMSEADQIWMLNRMVEEIAVADEQLQKMQQAYVSRELGQLLVLQKQYMYDDSEADDRFIYQLLNVRNVRMAKRLQPILKQGKAFIAIGALHLPGKEGVLHLLEQQGYKVTAIY